MASQLASTCVNPSAGILLGFGVPIGQAFDQTALTATGTITLTPNNPISKGKLRVQGLNPNVATTIAIGAITATNGTSTVQIGSTANISTTAAGTEIDFLKEFILPFAATSFSIPVTLAGATTTVTLNSEVSGNP